MVIHTQTIRWLLADELFECVLPFCGLLYGRTRDTENPYSCILYAVINNINSIYVVCIGMQVTVNHWRHSRCSSIIIANHPN